MSSIVGEALMAIGGLTLVVVLLHPSTSVQGRAADKIACEMIGGKPEIRSNFLGKFYRCEEPK